MKTTITTYTSQKISNISLVAILMVLIQHGSYDIANTGLSGIFKNTISFGLCDFPVSFFFVVSGFFIARNFSPSWSWYVPEIKKRIRSLLIPYLTYSLLGFFIWGSFSYDTLLDGLGITSLLPIVGPLWYVRNLIVFCLFSPLIILVTKAISKNTYFSFIASAIFLIACIMPFSARTSVGMPALYFTLGTFIALHGEFRQRSSVGIKFFASFAILIVLLILKAKHETNLTSQSAEVFLRWYVVPVTICVIWFGYDIAFRGSTVHLPAFLGLATHSTFFIYCSESFIRFGLDKVIIILNIRSFTNTPLGAIILALLIMFISLFLRTMLNRISPRIYEIFSGGR